MGASSLESDVSVLYKTHLCGGLKDSSKFVAILKGKLPARETRHGEIHGRLLPTANQEGCSTPAKAQQEDVCQAAAGIAKQVIEENQA